MNKFFKAGMAVLAGTMLLAGCGSADSAQSQAKTIYVGISPDYPPYESIEGDEIVGFDVDMAAWLFNYMNENEGTDYSYQFRQMSFDTIISAVQTDQVQLGISGFTYEKDREKAIAFSEPYNDSAEVIVVAADSAVASADDLKGKTVGAQLGATGESAANDLKGKLEDDMTVKTNQDVKVLMEALKNGQIDAVVLDAAVAENYQANGDYKIVGEDLMAEQNYIIAGKENKELLDQVNEAVKAFVQSDDYVQLKEKWGV